MAQTALLGIRLLNLLDINHLAPELIAQAAQGTNFNLYFQLTDESQNGCGPAPVSPCGCSGQQSASGPRYVPGVSGSASATGTLTFGGITSATVSITAVIAGTSVTVAYAVDNGTTVLNLATAISSTLALGPLGLTVTPPGADTDPASIVITAPPGVAGNAIAISTSLVDAGTAYTSVSGAYLTGGAAGGSATCLVTLQNINGGVPGNLNPYPTTPFPTGPMVPGIGQQIVRFATQPFLGLDNSIWMVPFFVTDPLYAGTYNLKVQIVENPNNAPNYAYLSQAMAVQSVTQGQTQFGLPSSYSNEYSPYPFYGPPPPGWQWRNGGHY